MSEPRSQVHDAKRPLWVRRLLITLGAALLIVIVILLGAAFLPRWWAHRVAAQSGGNFTAGIALGLAYGFFFTAVPLAVLQWAFRKRRPLRRWATMVGTALLLAVPNLLTLGIVVGTGNAAHAGERTLDVEAPGFRAATLAGVISAAAVFLVGGYLLTSRRRTRERLERMSAELRSREAAGAAEARPRPE